MTRIALAVLLAASVASAQEFRPVPLEIGAPAPGFDLPGADGKNHKLSDFVDAELLLVIFNTNHCPTAQLYEDRVRRIVTEYRPKGVATVVISPSHPRAVRLDELGYTDVDDSLEAMKIRAKHRKFNYPYLFDGIPNKVSKAYGPRVTPHAFLFDKERKLRYQGRIDDGEWERFVTTHDLRNAIDALLAGREVKVAVTRPFGCSVKWPFKQAQIKGFLAKIAAETVSVNGCDGTTIEGLRRNETGKNRLIYLWSPSSELSRSQLPKIVTMNHMYRRRNIVVATIAVTTQDRKGEVLGILRENRASTRNLIFEGKSRLYETFGGDVDAKLPLTVLVSASNEILCAKAGKFDDLELKRLIVANLSPNRLERYIKRRQGRKK